ncbi:MAG: AraC family transcriptional regulator [Lachnospiraceae bacterium]|nr:AraC family transcriptional regulator [Lachnospiraceae bacterium]
MQIVTDPFQKELKEHGNYQFPLLVSRERLSRYESGSFLWHWHPEIELTLIESGEMSYHFSNYSFHLRQDDILFGNANALHAGEMLHSSDCSYISVTFDPKLIYGYDKSLIYQKYVRPLVSDVSLSGMHFDGSLPWHRDLYWLVRDIIRLYDEKPPLYEIDIVLRLQRFWKNLCLHTSAKDSASSGDLQNNQRIRMILEYIAEHYASRIYLEDIASYIGLCKSECCRLFKRCMKISLFEFLLEYRIEKSLILLADPELNITEIAERSGFNDSNYYSKAFRKVKGCSPSGYRKRLSGAVHSGRPGF